MSFGRGKYDDLCTTARETAEAETVVLLVFNGNKGSGFSVQTTDPNFSVALPAMLRYMADDIEQSMQPQGMKQ